MTFFDSDSNIENFLSNIKSRLVPYDNKVAKIKCKFSLVKIQSSVDGCDVSLSNLRYWLADINKIKYFNDFV